MKIAELEQIERELQEQELASLPQNEKGVMIQDALRSFGQEIFNPDDLTFDTYAEMIQDASVASSLKVIINMVIGRGWEINGGTSEVREFIEEMYRNLPMGEVFRQVLSALWVGYSVTEKVFQQMEDGSWIIRKYKTLPPETISFEVFPNGEIRRVFQFGSFLGYQKTVRFLPKKVNIFTYDGGLSTNFGNPYGVSILKAAYTDWYSKNWIMSYKNRFLELQAGGLLVANSGNYDRVSLHNQVVKAKHTVTLEEGQDLKYVIPEGDGDAFLKSLFYHDRRIREALLVPVLLIGQEGQIGSGGLGKKQFELFERSMLQSLQQQLTAWIRNDIKQITDINFGPQEEYPFFRFKVASDEELLVRAQITKTAISSGISGIFHDDFWHRFNEMPSGDKGPQYILPNKQQQPETANPDNPNPNNDIDEELEQLREELNAITNT
jgi:hypothetical protein